MRKTRAQQDAERLASLEAAQTRVDAGEVDPGDAINAIESGESVQDAADREAMYQEIEQRAQTIPQNDPPKREDNSELETLRREMANMKRTLSHYEQELNPAQRRAQQLEREVEELRAKLAEVPAAPSTPEDYGLTEEEQEFETVKSISEKISDAKLAKFMKELDSVKSKLKNYEDANAEMSVTAEIAKHRSALSKALNGDDPDALFTHPKITEWMQEQSDEESRALMNPLAYSPKFVAGVLTRFRSEVLKGQVKREPSHGESAVPSRVAPDTAERVRDGGSNTSVSFNPRTFQADVQKLISAGNTAEAERLIKTAERAMSA